MFFNTEFEEGLENLVRRNFDLDDLGLKDNIRTSGLGFAKPMDYKVRITERLAAYVLIFHCVLFTCFLKISVSHGREKTPVLGLVSCQLFLYHTVFRQNVCTALLLAVHETKLLF